MSAERLGARLRYSELSPESWRVLALKTPTLPPATHTNCVIVGLERLTLIDPASPYPEAQAELEALLDALIEEGAQLERVALTHHHPDHIGGVERLVERYGCEVWAHEECARRLRFEVTHHLEDGAALPIGAPGLERLIALHTPGHAPGHLCFVNPLTREAAVGDMVAGEGTILIDPEEGDMAQYLAQLARLERLELKALWPSHGPALKAEVLARYQAHRLAREERVLEALSSSEWRGLGELAELAYSDAHPMARQGRHGGIAGRSAWAHLIKLEREGRVVKSGASAPPVEQRWRLAFEGLSLSAGSQVGVDMERLHGVMRRVRGGCLWMRSQDLISLKPYLIEESNELLEALELPAERGVDAHRDELGDVLLQVVLQSVIREEEGAFTLRDVLRGLSDKLVRRHPHVFGDAEAESLEEVEALWRAAKAAERAALSSEEQAELSAALWRPPSAAAPALSRAVGLSQAAARFGFDWPSAHGALDKVLEEREEVLEAMKLELGEEALRGELGDLLFAAVNACRLLSVDPAQALHSTCERFEERIEGMERLAQARGLQLKGLSLDELEALWVEAKRLS